MAVFPLPYHGGQKMNKLRVGFIGLGLMGNPMAKNIIKNGFDLTVYNRTQSKAQEFTKLGAKIALTPGQLAKEADVVITMVTGPQDVKQVIFGNDGIKSGANKGLVVVDMSTIGPSAAIETGKGLNKIGVEFLDAPVTGSVPKAVSGELTIFIGGNKKAFEKAKPVLLAIGQALYYIGSFGKGQAVKLVNNLIVGESITALAEGMLLADFLGLSRKSVMDSLSDVPALSPFMKLKLPNMVNNRYPAIFSLANMRKDLKLALDETKDKGELPILKLVEKLFDKGMDLGLTNDDLSAILKVLSK